MQEIQQLLDALFGLSTGPTDYTVGQVVVRAVLIYVAGWAMIRIGEHRFLGRNTAFDIILGFVLGSMLSRSINGSGPLSPTIVAGFALLAMHWGLATLTSRFDRLDRFFNGRSRPLIRDGQVDREQMRKARINERILRENTRINGGVASPSQVEQADFEPSGQISVVPRKDEPRVVEIDVRDGVQVVRIQFGG